jgi:hypothetical protein
VDKIAVDLAQYSKGPVATVKPQIVLSAVPTPEGVGLLLPAVQVVVAPAPADLDEEEQAKLWTTAGIIRDYPLVHMPEEGQEPDEPKPE